MLRCNECGALFEEPNYEDICLEDYNGVSDIFPDRHHYIRVASCPECGSAIDPEYDYVDEEEEDEFEE